MLNSKQKSHLRGLAHHKSISVSIGNAGLSEAVVNEINLSLNTHELLKIKLPAVSKEQKKALIQAVCEQCNAQEVQIIGRIGVVYKAGDPPRIELP